MSANHNATRSWLRLVERIIMGGGNIGQSERGEYNSDATLELVGCQSIVDMHYPVMTLKRRKLDYRFMRAEAWWILTGDDRLSTIEPWCKVIHKFSDDGVRFFGAYGPKVAQQLDGVIEKLTRDLSTRQAVINIWRENPPASKDIPCTTNVQFLVREGYIHCVDTMRSSDAWLGWPYDVFNFSMLSLYVALILKQRLGVTLKLGFLHFNAGSQHIYERNREGIMACLAESEPCYINAHFYTNKFESPMALIRYLDPSNEQSQDFGQH